MNKFILLFLVFVFSSSVFANTWQYAEQKDDFEGTTVKKAIIVSENKTKLSFPYNNGLVSAFLSVIKTSKGNLGVIIGTSNGLLICDFDNCQLKLKFDDNLPISFNVYQPRTGKNNVFIVQSQDVNNLLDLIKSSQKLIVRVQFYNDGYKDYVFSTQGLIFE